MFFYDTEKFLVVCNLRSGHTSMAHRFGMKGHTLPENHPDLSPENWLDNFRNSKAKTKVIVIRNPWDRLQSAINICSIAKKDSGMVFDEKFVRGHSNLYLSELNDSGFEDYYIIDFYKFSDYVPTRGHLNVSTNANYSGAKERLFDSEGNYLQNTRYSRYWPMKELHKEDKAYNKIMKRQPKLPVTLFQTFYK